VVTAAVVVVVLLLLPDVAAAGAASSLIFLVTFALAHWIAVLVRQRSVTQPPPFCTPLFPAVPVVGGIACLALAVYQGVAVPSAGRIAMIWLLAGGLLFLFSFARRARIVDASKAGGDPELVRLRGRSPLVLVPIANPHNARGLVAVATALAPSQVGRVMLLTVVPASRNWRPDEDPSRLQNAQAVLGEAIAASVHAGMFPEALTTVAEQTWLEISRVAGIHRCESLLLGLSQLTEQSAVIPLERLINSVDCDVVVLRAPKGWQLPDVNRILVPTGGGGVHERLLARLLASFARSEHREVTFLRVLPQQSPEPARRQALRGLRRIQNDLGLAGANVQVACSNQPVEFVAAAADEHDLTILGVQRLGRRQKLFGQFALRVAQQTACPLLLISHRG
jgi:nucleotide-binding universal stress UspA family protein